jgi:uncharacterized protein DUF547
MLRVVFLLLVMLPRALSAQSVDASDFTAVLRAHASERGVNYAALKADRARLDGYVTRVGTVTRTQFEQWPRTEQIAYLINAYNAIVLRSVIDEYPIKRSLNPAALVRPANSVWQIGGFFNEKQHRVAGRELTLDDIEHKVLRAQLKERRVHVALVCAARSCPPLRTSTYTADSLDTQLDDQARKFLADASRNHFDRSHGTVRLSEIFKWFADDFGGEKGVISFASRYVDPATAQWLQSGKYRVSYFDYDWNLNDTAAR